MVKELRFLLDKPSGLWLQNGSTLSQFCTLGGVETKIDHFLFISSFDQWIDLQDAIIGFEKKKWEYGYLKKCQRSVSGLILFFHTIYELYFALAFFPSYVASGL